METYAWSEKDTQKAQALRAQREQEREASERPVSFINWSHILGNKLEQPSHLEDPQERPHKEVELHTWVGGGAFLSPARPKAKRRMEGSPSMPLRSVNEQKTATQSEMATPPLSPLTGVAENMTELHLDSTPVLMRRRPMLTGTPSPLLARTTSSINPTQPGAFEEREFTMKEVEEHCWKNDCWIVVDDVVYDATDFGRRHPGGAEKIFENAGSDITLKYYGKGHKRKYLVRLKRMGRLKKQGQGPSTPDPALKRTITW